MALWLGPVAAFCAWTGSSALPHRSDEARGGSLCTAGSAATRAAQPASALLRKARGNPGEPVQTVPGMPPVLDPGNLYTGTAPDRLSPALGGVLSRVYVPNRRSNSVNVIDPATLAIVDRFPVGASPQHVVP